MSSEIELIKVGGGGDAYHVEILGRCKKLTFSAPKFILEDKQFFASFSHSAVTTGLLEFTGVETYPWNVFLQPAPSRAEPYRNGMFY